MRVGQGDEEYNRSCLAIDGNSMERSMRYVLTPLHYLKQGWGLFSLAYGTTPELTRNRSNMHASKAS